MNAESELGPWFWKWLKIFGSIVALFGFVMLGCHTNWSDACYIFLMFWGNNLMLTSVHVRRDGA